jgi:hypothetical protein
MLVLTACHATGAQMPDASVCSPISISTGSDAPHWFALDATSVYWSASTAFSDTSTIWRAPRCGSGAATVLYRGMGSPTKLIALDGTLYYADGLTPGNITAISIGDGTATILASENTTVTDLAADDQSLFWFDGDRLRRVPRTGGGVADLATGLALPDGLSIADSSLFWVNRGTETSPGQVVTSDKSGMPTTELAPGQNYTGGTVGALATDGQRVFFGGWLGELSVVDRSGGTVTMLASSQNPTAIAVQGDFVYWINGTNQPGTPSRGLWRTPTVGGGAESLDLDAIGDSLAFDSGLVFYLTSTAIVARAL